MLYQLSYVRVGADSSAGLRGRCPGHRRPMRRVALVALPLVLLGAIALMSARRRRRSAGLGEDNAADVIEAVERVDLPEAVGEPVEELSEVHEHVAAMPRRGPEEAEAESRTRPSGLTLYDEVREEEEDRRHGAARELSTDTLTPQEEQNA